MNGQYQYFAFLSHRGTDEAFTTWLKRKLERYVIPAKVRRAHGLTERHLKPVCLYQYDFAGTALKEEMISKLNASGKMILICTPASASPVAGGLDWSRNPTPDLDWWLNHGEEAGYVGYEIAYMLKQGRARDIILVVAGGDPFTGDCFHPLIRYYLGANAIWFDLRGKKKRDRITFLKIVAPILGVEYLNEILRFDAMHQRIRKGLWGLAALSLLAAAAFSWYYYLPHTRLAADYSLVEGIPRAIGSLSKREAAQLPGHYSITTQRSKHSVTLKHLNAHGTPVEDESLSHPDAPMIAVYRSRGNGTLETVEYRDRNDIVLITYAYATDMQYVSFQENEFTSTPVYPSVEENEYGVPVRLKIDRNQLSFDAEGRLITKKYMSGVNYVVDDTGVAGESYTYDEQGRLKTLRYLGRDGKPAVNQRGVAGLNYEYNENGSVTQERYVNLNGELIYGPGYYALRENTFDEKGFLLRTVYYGPEGQELICDGGYSRVEYQYNEEGDLSSVSYFGPEGPVFCPEGYHEARYGYNGAGDRTEESYYDCDGRMILSKAGYARIGRDYDARGNVTEVRTMTADSSPLPAESLAATVKRSYDDRGYLIREELYGVTGGAIIGKEGWHQRRITVDDYGRPAEIAYYGTDSGPVSCTDGYHKLRLGYNTQGNMIVLAVYGTQDQLLPFSGYWAVERLSYNGGGQVTEVSYEDQYGRPVTAAGMYARLVNTYSDVGLLTSTSYYDTAGKLTRGVSNVSGVNVGSRYYTRILYEYDEAGNVTKTVYCGEDGQPDASLEIAVLTYRYDETGRQTGESRRDADGSLVSGAAVFDYHYDSLGNLTGYDIYDREGKPAENTGGFSRLVLRKDPRGNTIYQAKYRADGSLLDHVVLVEYDENGLKVRESYTDETGSPVALEEGYAAIIWEYDDRNQTVLAQSQDLDGHPAWNAGGYSSVRYAYDENGNRIRTAYFDPEGAPVDLPAGYSAMVQRFNDFRNLEELTLLNKDGVPLVCYRASYLHEVYLVQEELFGRENMPIGDRLFGVHRVENSYDERGYLTGARYFGPDGKLRALAGLFAGWSSEYDGSGLEISRTYYGEDGAPCLMAGGFASVRFTRNELGQEVLRSYFDESGSPVDTAYGFSYAEIRYREDGEIASVSYFDREGHAVEEVQGELRYVNLLLYGEAQTADVYDAESARWLTLQHADAATTERRIAFLTAEGSYDLLYQPSFFIRSSGGLAGYVYESLSSYIPQVHEEDEAVETVEIPAAEPQEETTPKAEEQPEAASPEEAAVGSAITASAGENAVSTDAAPARDWRDMLARSVSLVTQGSGEDLMGLLEPQISDYSCAVLSQYFGGHPTQEEFRAFYADFYDGELKKLRESLTRQYGEGFTVSCDVLSVEELDEARLKEVNASINQLIGTSGDRITDFVQLTVRCTVTGPLGSGIMAESYLGPALSFYKVDGAWYHAGGNSFPKPETDAILAFVNEKAG